MSPWFLAVKAPQSAIRVDDARLEENFVAQPVHNRAGPRHSVVAQRIPHSVDARARAMP
jgi:hypothetical protein